MTRIQRLAIVGLSSLAALVFELNAWAVTQTTGAGSAVSIIEGTANFENPSALSDNPYLEGGMAFSRTDLTFDNGGCGFAGCSSHAGFVGFPETTCMAWELVTLIWQQPAETSFTAWSSQSGRDLP